VVGDPDFGPVCKCFIFSPLIRIKVQRSFLIRVIRLSKNHLLRRGTNQLNRGNGDAIPG
jgi:hypothetical protein